MCSLFYSAITSVLTSEPIAEESNKENEGADVVGGSSIGTSSTPATPATPSHHAPPRFMRSVSLMTHPRMTIQRFLFGMHQKTKRCLAEEAESGDETSVCSWLEEGYDPDELDSYGYTPLLNAASLGRYNAVNELIKNGADVNKRGPYGYTALHAAAQNGHRDVVSLLLSNGAQINAQNDDMDTPMHLALGTYRTEILFILLTSGGNVRIKGYGKKDCVELARELHLNDIAERLLTYATTSISSPHTQSAPLLTKLIATTQVN